MIFRILITTAALLGIVASSRAEPIAQLKKDVARAIKGGQEYLKAAQRANGGRPAPLLGPGGINPGAVMPMMGGSGFGPSALSGLALIESGLDASDPVVAALARLARLNALGTSSTYEISLLIMFLDRVGSKYDEGFIQFLTLRLLTGQNSDGTWSYTCNGMQLDPVEQRALYAELTKGVKLTTPEKPRPKKKEFKPREDIDDPNPGKKEPPKAKEEPKEAPTPKGILPAVEKFVGRRPGGVGQVFPVGGGDHSNTQFATVGLWCGRRHQVKVTDALKLIDKHYRNGQGGDGGWTYTGSGGASSPAMTCAGLMGLAMGFGTKSLDGGKTADADTIAQDRALEAGLRYVGNFISAAGDQRDGRLFRPNELSNNLYFIWSLERVGMVYGLTTIGKVDWYEWGAQLLVKTQQADGSWRSDGFHSGSPENATAFALLFLSRSNLAEEVSSKLNGKVKDPGTSRLKGGDLAKLLGEAGKPDAGVKKRQAEPKSPAVIEEDKAGKLAQQLVAAEAGERGALLIKYRDTTGVEYTDALARAAARTTGESQAAIRATLAQRLTRMKTSTLNDCMRHNDPELRRGAALAAGSKGKEKLPALVDNLIRLTADDESIVAQAARASLKVYADKDFGPELGASAAERGKALIAWRNWWSSQKQ